MIRFLWFLFEHAGVGEPGYLALVVAQQLFEDLLIVPPQRIRDRYKEWENSGATGLTLSCRRIEGLELMAELTGSRDRVA